MKNRELKFRVWDKRFKQFIDDKNYESDEIIFAWTSFGILSPKDYQNDIEIQQFTGLKDKNNKDIYEGDIVAFTEWGVPESWVHNYLNDGLKIVKWSLNAGGDYPFAGFTFIKYNAGDLDIGVLVDCMNIQYCKVIGNIFENKDLLK